MQRCLYLAKLGAGNVAPNPMVGAVLVYNNRIIGEGYHQEYGKAHAEVNCINSVSEADQPLIEQSSIYVSLEPCAHHGKTPPCADLIIKNKIPTVIVGCRDSYEEVNGRGIEKLKAASVHVIVGVLEKECLELNKRFFTFYTKHRPYIILKWAQSNNAKIANADYSKVFISNEQTNRLVHTWRSEEAAIMIGTNTALQDNPSLTTRLVPGNNPVRLVIDMELKLPTTLNLFDGTVRTIVFNKIKHSEGIVFYYKVENNIDAILRALYHLRIQSVLVEGGTKLLQSFIDSGNWDEARVITNPGLIIESGIEAPVLKGEIVNHKESIINDSISYYTKSKTNA
jgi:diaminohydroxyphosphoribosylaminopyrimidine deaminase/5-amino-6-(5-phosphoribosylamino)uracil reductase